MRRPVDYSGEMRRASSPGVRLFFLALGTVFFVIGLVGVVMPVLPTTPFMLLAAGCYARASARFYNWLMNHPAFGPTLVEWRRHRAIPYRTKLWAIALMSLTLASSIVFFVEPLWAKAALALLGVGLAVWLYRVPSRDRPARG